VNDPRAAGVRNLLAGHVPADDAEAGHLRRIAGLLESEPRPFDRTRFAPGHITASGFVMDSRRRLLLVHHRRLGIWIQPGGHIDPTDDGAEAAARREITEEAGLDGLELLGSGLLDVDVHDYPARPDGDPAHRHFDVRFAYRATHPGLSPNDEVHEARWVAFTDLASLGVDHSILRPAAKLLR
jgi:8-oxo-dGTP pyrophosphatase MutT (NUDIX family)